jgi:hypothetical protein
VTVGAPMAFVGERGCIEHDDAAVAVTVGDINLVRVLVDRGFRGLAELCRVI